MHFAGLHMGDDSKENDPPTDSNETQTRKDRQSRTASPSLKRKHHCLSELSVNIGDRGRSKLHRKSHWAPPPSSNPPSSPSVIDLTDLPSSPIQSIDLTELPSSPVRGSTGISTDLIGQPHNLLITHDEFFGQWIYNMPLHGLLRYARDPSQSMGFKEAASSELERRFLLAAGMVLNGSQVVVKDVM
ncbi:hypothetical protein CC80DRAFT_488412 [Byssothecium circinans]|uniref:Uncharacterized protein n=1 Tax=Byssothecium circinans TaxID=147558 RepID=A0A6A5UBG0_9PLEO|nr:hypothetical protein CC80DRAFT_488412 [Byssothecium circinans]